MDQLLNAYKLFYKTRRWTAISLGGFLFLKNTLPDLLPQYVFMPMNASLECSHYPFSYQSWLLRITQHDMNLSNNTISAIPFISTRFEACSAGFAGVGPLKPVSMLGIPKNFYCTNIIEVDELGVHIGRKKVDGMQSQTEQDLLQSLILSESAQKFAVARELYYILDNWSLLRGILPSAFVFLGYFLCFHGPRLLFAKGAPVSLVSIFRFTVISVFVTWLSCKLAKSVFLHRMIYSIDEKAAKVNSEYAEGGVEYFEKHCAWNKACKVLLGAKGDKIFTVTGNEKDGMFVNWKGPSNTQRKKRICKILKSFKADEATVT